jgi:elongation factor Ts
VTYAPPAPEVKRLRDATGAGMMECKRALVETAGDFDKSVELLRSWGLAGAQKRAGRVSSEGLIEAYLHQTSPDLPPKVGVLVELNCETDFVAKSPEFKELARHIAQQIAAMRPRWVTKDEVTEEDLETERRVIMASDAVEGKKPEIVEKIVEGRLRSLFSDQGGALLEQVWWRDNAGKKTIGELVNEFGAKVKENVTVGRFAHFRVGESPSGENS